jgi:uncharacterized membrane protein (UPF0136 family)
VSARELSSLGRATFWLLNACGYLAAWFLTTVLPVPLPWYYPLERRFALEVQPHGLAADFFGRTLVSLAAGLAVGAVGQRLAGLLRTPGRRRWAAVAAVWSAALLALTAGLYAYTLWGRAPVPLPLPVPGSDGPR